MKSQVKRTVYMIVIAVMLFSASMAIPLIYHSKAREYFQGAAFGFMLAGIISIVILLLDMIKKNKA
ncbi:hypothetical protein [Mucilaginibacter sp.]|uniref:hypothetical protein n=1 Tax=Mucilaginibacter sp. TaxID=1882438 RepID=UPI003565EFAD